MCSFDDFGKPELTSLAYSLIAKETPNVHLQKGDSTQTLIQFMAQNPHVRCDVMSIAGAQHDRFRDQDMEHFKYFANYPNLILIDDYHEQDWPAVVNAVKKHSSEGSMKVRHVAASSIIFRDKQKQWAIGEYTLLTLVILTQSLDRLQYLKATIDTVGDHPVLQHVIVIWNGPSMPLEVAQLARHPSSHARVTVIQRDTDTWNTRYDPTLPVHTGAVMIVGDGSHVTKETIDCSFGAWKQDPSRLYAFGEGRIANAQGYNHPSEKGTDANFLLPGMIFHKTLLGVFFRAEYAKIRAYVDTQSGHGDDVAFASIVTKYTGKAMVHVPAPYRDLDGDEVRSECVKQIIAILSWELPRIEQAVCG